MAISIDELYHLYQDSAGICTDTRKIIKDCLFIALKGPNFNANEFASEALDKGAKYAVVDEALYADGPKKFLVDDGLSSLQELARSYRGKMTIPVIGITGSNGKTTTKELISQVLGKSYKIYYTQGNLNNHIGVPLTILSITPEVEIAVVEMGANHVGEIAALCSIAQPSHGLITNIGHAHIEGFGGFEGVIRGKSELYQYLIDTKGTVFINSEDEILSNMAKRFSSPLFYPGQGDYICLEYKGADPFLKFLGEDQNEVRTKLIGAYNYYNVAVALCIGKYFKVPRELAEEAVSQYVPTNNRSQVLKKGNNTLILDAYNANPSSMSAAIKNLIAMDSISKIAVLGDMMELGAESESAHQEMAQLALSGVTQLLLVGPQMSKTKINNQAAYHFSDKEQLVEHLKKHPPNNSTILIKASRSMGLEEIVDYL